MPASETSPHIPPAPETTRTPDTAVQLTTGTTPRQPRSYSHPATTEKLLALLEHDGFADRRFLDLGAGEGYLSAKLLERAAAAGVDLAASLTACDLHPEAFLVPAVECRPADFNERLPFDDASFDTVLCMEVIEHLPNQLRLFEEIARVTKPGGTAYVTTPNVLTANARLRYLLTGTLPLFDVLPIAGRDVVHVDGHIAPVSPYYLFYFARLAGFSHVRFHVDRTKKSAAALSTLLWPLTRLAGLVHDLERRRKPHWLENRTAARQLNSWQTLTGRTIVVEARK